MGAISKWYTALKKLWPLHLKHTPTSKEVGFAVEKKALVFLQQQGLKLLAKNYTCPFGEIDLIMQQDAVVVFVEVRFRATSTVVQPLETVTPQKQQRIKQTAEHYLLKRQWVNAKPCRFDVVAAVTEQNQLCFTWELDAF